LSIGEIIRRLSKTEGKRNIGVETEKELGKSKKLKGFRVDRQKRVGTEGGVTASFQNCNFSKNSPEKGGLSTKKARKRVKEKNLQEGGRSSLFKLRMPKNAP